MRKIIRRWSKYIASVLICSVAASCSASSHLGVTTIEMPAMDETRAQRWFLYYQDQFDGRGGIVETPSEQYPPAAHAAYQKALEEWKTKEVEVKNQNQAVAIIFIGALIAGILLTDWNSPGDGWSFSWR